VRLGVALAGWRRTRSGCRSLLDDGTACGRRGWSAATARPPRPPVRRDRLARAGPAALAGRRRRGRRRGGRLHLPVRSGPPVGGHAAAGWPPLGVAAGCRGAGLRPAAAAAPPVWRSVREVTYRYGARRASTWRRGRVLLAGGRGPHDAARSRARASARGA
jgi:hypothetical protein